MLVVLLFQMMVMLYYNDAYAGLSIDVGSTGAARNAAAENDLKCRSGSK